MDIWGVYAELISCKLLVLDYGGDAWGGVGWFLSAVLVWLVLLEDLCGFVWFCVVDLSVFLFACFHVNGL